MICKDLIIYGTGLHAPKVSRALKRIGSNIYGFNHKTGAPSENQYNTSGRSVTEAPMDDAMPTACFHFVKIDVEGNDLAALKGMEKLLNAKILSSQLTLSSPSRHRCTNARHHGNT